MPGFFDFTFNGPEVDPMAPAFGQVAPQNQPIVPENYDIFGSGMPQMPQSPQMGGGVPYDALGAMAGIQMPEIPQQDDMGRYGITDSQRRGAGDQSLAAILRGAGATLFNDRPDDVMAAAARSGDIRRGALDKASLENVNAFKLKADAEAKKLDMIGKMSDIQRQQLQIESEKMKLEDLKMQRAVAVEFGNEMAPVMTDLLKKTAEMYPDKVGVVKAKLLVAKEKLAAGDLAGADIAFDNAKMELPGEWQKEMEEQMIRKSLEAGTKYGIGLEMSASPELQAKAKAAGGVIEADANGMPSFVSAHDLQVRQLETAKINAQIRASDANAAYYNNGGSGGANGGVKRMTPGQIATKEQQLSEIAGKLGLGKPDLTDPKDQARWEQENAANMALFKMYGITPEEWLTTSPERRRALIESGGTQPAGPVTQQGGGDPLSNFKAAAGGDALAKATALGALIKSSPGYMNMFNQARAALQLPAPTTPEEKARQASILYTYIAAQTAR